MIIRFNYDSIGRYEKGSFNNLMTGFSGGIDLWGLEQAESCYRLWRFVSSFGRGIVKIIAIFIRM